MTANLEPPDALPEIECRVTWRSGARLPLRCPWYVRRLELFEPIDAPFLLRLQVDTDDLDLDVLDLVGGELSVALGRASVTSRALHGVVMRSEVLRTSAGRLEFGVDVGPAAALAGLGARTRVFQRMDVPAIAEAVLGAVLTPLHRTLERRLSRTYPPRDYVVQWRESDLDFVLRILADAGVGCVFEQGDEAETMVLVDTADGLRGVGFDGDDDPTPTLVPLVAEHAGLPADERVAQLGPARSLYPGRFDALGWDWQERPPSRFESTSTSPDAAWPAPLLEDPSSRRLVELASGGHLDETELHARAAHSQAAVGAAKVSGWGDVLSFTAGRTFELTGHPLVQHDVPYLLTRVVHRATFPRSDEPGSAGRARYFNEFIAHPLALGHAPARRPRPRADGLHTAIVVGPSGEEIHTDEHARIRVRFPWDRDGVDDGGTSCWLRCVQPWAGAGYGAMFVPRVGMEVLVAFIDGDPDQPICTGCVYNGGNPTPDSLPEHKTRTILRSSSTPGGVGYNELSFEDAAGREEVHLHAQRDLREVVRANHSARVGGHRSHSIGANDSTSVGGNASTSIAGDAVTTVMGAAALAIGGSQSVMIAGPRTTTVGAPGALATAPGVGVRDTTMVHGTHQLVVDGQLELVGNDGAHVLTMATDGVTLSHGPGGGAEMRGAATDWLTLGYDGIVVRASHRITLAVGESTLVIDDFGVRITAPDGKTIGLSVHNGSANLELTTAKAELKSGAALIVLDGAAAQAAMRAPESVVHGDTSAKLESDGETTVIGKKSAKIDGTATTTITGDSIDVTASTGGVIKVAKGMIDLN